MPLAVLKDATMQLGSWHKGKAGREKAVVRGLYCDKTERPRVTQKDQTLKRVVIQSHSWLDSHIWMYRTKKTLL